jgi:phage-related minor tail protein
MASQNIARLGVVLGIDTAEFTAGVDKAIAENKKLKASIQRESNAAAKEIIALKYATEDYGKAVTKVEQIQREIMGGKFRNASQQLKDQLLAQAAAYDKVAASSTKAKVAQLGMLGAQLPGGQLSQQQLAALSYQTTDIVTGLVSGQNPLIVLIQQGGQLRDQFGGVVNVFKAFASILTPMRLIVGGVAGAIGGLAYAAYQGDKNFKELRNSLALTNNIAGLTYDSIKRLSTELSDGLNVSSANSREIFTELIRSGRFVADSMGPVAEVIARVSRLSGETASTVAKDLIPSFNGSASSAKSLNDRFNFLTEAQYRQIEALELTGKKQEAVKMTADLLNKSLEKQTKDLEIAEGWWKRTTRAISDMIEKIKQIGAPETDEEKLARLAKRIEDLSKINILGMQFDAKAYGPLREQAIKDYLQFYQDLVKKRQQIEANAAKQQSETQGINDFAAAGGEKKRQEIIAATRKQYSDLEFQQKVAGANEFQRIELEGQRKRSEAYLEFERQNELTRGKMVTELRGQLNAKLASIEYETQQKILEVSRQAAEELRKEQQNRADGIDLERTKLQIYEQNLFISKADYQIALNRLKAEQEIAKINANTKLTPQAKEEAIAREREMQRQGDAVARLGERLEHLREVNSAVFKSMESAVVQFVQTGKFSFKDFAGSVIRDILAIYMKSQLLGMFNTSKGFFSNFFGGSTSATGSYMGPSVSTIGFAADGGYINGPTIVGEQGPELFIPRTAGTVVPNQQMNNFQPQPQIVYNGPYIQNMSAIDTQSATQFLSRNKDAVYSANLSASRSLPVSR